MSDNNNEENNIDLGAVVDEAVEAMSPVMKDFWVRTLFLLNQSERYVTFMEENFDIHQKIDDETKTIDLAVIEKPVEEVEKPAPTGITMDTAKSLKAQMLLKSNGCNNTAKVMESLIKILTGADGKSEGPSIIAASEADLKKELMKKKLD